MYLRLPVAGDGVGVCVCVSVCAGGGGGVHYEHILRKICVYLKDEIPLTFIINAIPYHSLNNTS